MLSLQSLSSWLLLKPFIMDYVTIFLHLYVVGTCCLVVGCGDKNLNLKKKWEKVTVTFKKMQQSETLISSNYTILYDSQFYYILLYFIFLYSTLIFHWHHWAIELVYLVHIFTIHKQHIQKWITLVMWWSDYVCSCRVKKCAKQLQNYQDI